MTKWAHITKGDRASKFRLARAYCGVSLSRDNVFDHSHLPVCPRCQKAAALAFERDDRQAALEEDARMNEVLGDEGSKRSRDEEHNREEDYRDSHPDV